MNFLLDTKYSIDWTIDTIDWVFSRIKNQFLYIKR